MRMGASTEQPTGLIYKEVRKIRNLRVDIIKGILIILVVIGHSDLGKDAIISIPSFIYLFHMPCFFMVSGYLFSYKALSLRGGLDYLKRKIKALWVPYFFMTVLFILLNNVFIKIGIYTNSPSILDLGTYGSIHSFMTEPDMVQEILKAVFFGAHVELGGTFWFFKALFSVGCLYYIIEYSISRVVNNNNEVTLRIQSAISMIFLSIGYICAIHDTSVFGMARSLSIYSLYHFGRLIKCRQLNRYCVNRITALVSLAVLICLSYFGHISLDINYYVNPIFLFVASLAGWCLVNYISSLVLNSNIATRFLSICGKASLYIMVLHLISFKLVSILQTEIYGLPKYYVAAFPVLYRNQIWAIVYSIVGVMVPIAIYMVKENLKKRVKTWELKVKKR